MIHGALKAWFTSNALRLAPLLLGIAWSTTPSAMGEAIFLPSGLEPGSTFQIAFVTSGVTRATSSNIATYNAFVTAAARAAGLDVINGQEVTWTAIVSTATVDARDNAPQTAPVYNLQDRLITPEAGGLWDSLSTFFENPINVTERGDELFWGYVWTGTDHLGEVLPYYAMGSPFAVGVGDLSSSFPTWASTAVLPTSSTARLYALSSPIRAVVVPEPASTITLAIGLVAITLQMRKRRTRPDGFKA